MISCYPELKKHSQTFDKLITQYIDIVNKTLSNDDMFSAITPSQYGQIHLINENLATLKISATSFLEYTRLIIEHCNTSPSFTGSQNSRLLSVFSLGNNLSALVDKIKMDLEEINTRKVSSVSDMLSRIESITCNFTSAVNKTARLSKECYDRISNTQNIQKNSVRLEEKISYFGRN